MSQDLKHHKYHRYVQIAHSAVVSTVLSVTCVANRCPMAEQQQLNNHQNTITILTRTSGLIHMTIAVRAMNMHVTMVSRKGKQLLITILSFTACTIEQLVGALTHTRTLSPFQLTATAGMSTGSLSLSLHWCLYTNKTKHCKLQHCKYVHIQAW
jgi:hypothetical protein